MSPRETFRILWHGIVIDIRYDASWLTPSVCDLVVAHLEVESVAPARTPLPITETGYRSHFTSPDAVSDCGGPIAFVEAWLESECRSTAWRRTEEARRQPTLF